jgi:hypothetical protein
LKTIFEEDEEDKEDRPEFSPKPKKTERGTGTLTIRYTSGIKSTKTSGMLICIIEAIP